MKYSIIPEADVPIKCHCNGELYFALQMENLSPMDDYQVKPVPGRQSTNARDAGCLKSQFARSAKRPVGDDAAGSPNGSKRPIAAYVSRSTTLVLPLLEIFAGLVDELGC